MADDRIVKILLQMGLSESGVKKALADFDKYQKSLRELEKEAQLVRDAIQKATSVGENTDELNAELERISKTIGVIKRNADSAFGRNFVSGAEAAAQAQQRAANAAHVQRTELEKAAQAQQDQAVAAERAAREARDNAFHLRDVGEKLNQIGGAAINAGRSVTSPIMGAMNSYLQNASPYDSTAQKWASAQKDIQASYERIGAVAAENLLPAIDAASDLVSKIADFVEKNPDLVKAALILGGGMQVVGGGLQAVGQMAMLAGSLKALGIPLPGGGAIKDGIGTAGKAVGGFLAGTGGAILGGLGAGFAGYEALAQSDIGKRAGLANLGQYASVAAYGVGSLFGQDTAQEWFTAIGELTGAIEKQTDVEEKKSTPGANPETLQLFADYQAAVDERKAAEARHEQERTDLVNEQGAQRAALEGRFEARRTDIVQQFARQAFDAAAAFAKNEMRLEQDYYNQRQQAAQRFGIDAARMEADHQKEMRRMQEDHNLRVGELVSSRDALGLVKAQRDYEQNRRRAEEDYSTQAARRRQDYAQQMRDMEQSFAQQRARRAQDYQEQQAQREADQAARLAELEAQRVLELAEFEKTSQERMDLLRDQQRREMDTLKANESAREKLLTAIAIRGMTQTQYQAEQLFRTFNNRFNDWLNGTQRYGTNGGVIGPPKPPGYAAGGYIYKRGIYEMAENGSEYVLDKPTTQAAERLMGQKITHQNLLQSLAAGGRNGSTVNLSFPGGLVSMPLLLDILDQREARLGDLIARAMEL